MAEVYVLHVRDDLHEDAFNRLMSYVDAEKQNRILAFHFFRDRQLSLFADILIRYLVSKKLQIPNGEMSFSRLENGKPYLCGQEHFHYNLSHTKGYVVCAVHDREVGVDVENIGRYDADLAQRIFHPEEMKVLREQPEADHAATFYDIWTKKESYVKLLGDGLRLPLKSFSVYAPERNHVTYHRVFRDHMAVCSLCVRSTAPPAVFHLETGALYDAANTYLSHGS